MSQEPSPGMEANRYEQKHPIEPKTPGFELRTESLSLLEEDDGKNAEFKPVKQRISLINLAVNWVLRSRITIRVLAVMASLVSFILITYSVVLFENAQKEGKVKDSTGGNPHVDTKPAVTFSGIGGASFFLSLLLLFACCGTKKMKNVNDLSNAVFAIIGCCGFAAWMTGCTYMSRSSLVTKPLWHYACQEKGNSHPGVDFAPICNLSTYAWDIGILQACFDLLTVLNVILAFMLLRMARFQRFGKF